MICPVFLSIAGGTGNWCTWPLWPINDWSSNLGFHVSCHKYACKWNRYTCKGPWRWLLWNMKWKSKAIKQRTQNFALIFNQPSFPLCHKGFSMPWWLHPPCHRPLAAQSVVVLWESSTDLPTTSQFWLELRLSSIFSSLREDNAGGIWSDAKHVNMGSMTVNYYCRPVPPSPSFALRNEVSSLIKLIIYFIICPFPSLSIPTVTASQLR